ncbi:MAG: pyridoxal-phosphate dependent enzyme [Acidobacteria bacterium]|nr:pyridoxal-phosphate dependent enzyme [Acidobacteriota bacterium]
MAESITSPQPSALSLLDVLRARRRIAPYVRRTPLVPSPWLSDLVGARVSLKLESLQISSSFKSRGAFNAVIARLERPGHAPGRLVTASAGNHGRALAAAAETFRLPLVVFTPADAPQTKLAAIRRHGAELRAVGRDYDDAERLAKGFAEETRAEFISPYNDADVIAGAGTVGLEILEDAADTDTLVVPIGGGGLISGVGTAAKAIDPRVELVGVEVEASCAFQTSIAAGRLVEIVPGQTLADGLGGNPDPATITWPIIQRLVDRTATVSENDLAAAVVGLVEAAHLIAEGAAAVGVAAVMSKRIDVASRRVVVVVTGANIDRAKLSARLSRP